MPIFMELFGYGIYFWSNEGNPLEPIHVHVSKSPHSNATKIWLLSDGSVQLENNNDNIPSKDLKKIMRSVSEFSDDIIELWLSIFEEISYIDQKEQDIDYER